MRIWLPAIKAGSGTDVFTERLAAALRSAGADAVITWYPHRYEFLPGLMRFFSPMPEDIDVIHANSWNGSVFMRTGKPVVVTVHHLVHDPAYAPYRSFAQAAYHRWHIRRRELKAVQRAAAVTAVSSYVAGTVRRFSGRDGITVIPNWVDTARYRPAEDYRFDTQRRFRLLMVGNTGRRKGSDLLGALLARLGEAFELRCTGGLRHADRRSREDVVWLGHLSEAGLIDEYQHCDAVISLSRYEGFGYTALEAMACGKPFVGFDTSGLAEVVSSGVTGMLVPVDDVDALARQCHLLREQAALRENMACAARQAAMHEFSEKNALDGYIGVYRQAIESCSSLRGA